MKGIKKSITGIVINSLLFVLTVYIDYKFFGDHCGFTNLVETLFSSILVLIGIWVSCYLLFIELYKDSYHFNAIKNELLPIMKSKYIDIIYLIVVGIILLVLDSCVISAVYYGLLSILALISIFKMAYSNSEQLMTINTYVDKFAKEIECELTKPQDSDISIILKKIKNVFDESIIKGEFFVIQNICEKSSGVFRCFLKNSIGKQDVEENFERIVEFNIYTLQLCEKISSDSLRIKIIRLQYENLMFCIDNHQTDWYKEYFSKYNQYVFHLQKDSDGDLKDYIEDLYYVYKLLTKRFIQNDKTDILVFTFDEIEKIIRSVIFVNKNSNIHNYINLLIYAIINYKEKDHFVFEIAYKKLVEFSIYLFETRDVFDNVKVYYAFLFNELKSNDINDAIKFYDDIFETIKPSAYNTQYIEFKQYCIRELLTNIPKEEVEKRETVFKYHTNSLFELINADIDYNGFFFLPDFEEEIYNNRNNKNRIEVILNDVRKLINQCIIKDNVSAYFQIINSLNSVLEKTCKQDREIQISLLDIYFWGLSRTSTVVNKHFFAILYDLLTKVIDSLDKNRAISDALGDYIIDSLASKAQNVNSDARKLQDDIIEMFFSFMYEKEAMHFIISSSEKKRRLCRKMFNIGIDCIENNYEEGLRAVSNAIGWFTIYSIKQGTGDLTTYLIDRAVELYDISKKMDVSEKTKTFILTLFTTVGMYCCKDAKNRGYVKKIHNGIKEELDKINVAVRIRTSENDTWNELFEGKTDELRKIFLKEFEK